MSMTNNSVAAQNSRYLQSLVDYVLDVKPFRTKLARTGAVSEEYIFSDIVNANISESERIRAFLGADVLASPSVALGVRSRLSNSWIQDLVSDGVRRIWPMPNITVPKLAYHSNRTSYTVGIDDYTGIPGLSSGVLDQRRWDFKGITDVRLNGVHQQDSSDYFLSHGVFSFNTFASLEGEPTWIQHDLNNSIPTIQDIQGDMDTGGQELVDPPFSQTLPFGSLAAYAAFGELPGTLLYKDVQRLGGTLENVTGETYEEFYAVCTAVEPAVLTVYSPNETAPVGTVNFGDTFTLLDGSGNTRIQFTFTFSPGQIEETSQLDDRYDIEPQYKIVLAPDVQDEVWSLIKVNPIGLTQKPVWIPNPMVVRDEVCALEIHTTSIENTVASDWTIVFGGNGTYTLNAYEAGTSTLLPGYPQSVSLVEGCSYRDANIAFTIIPIVAGNAAGDAFSWSIGPVDAHYKVFGSVSGWTTDIYTGLDAQVGKQFWNGSIGFKIPKLEMFAEAYRSTISSSSASVESWSSNLSNGMVLYDIIFVDGVFIAIGEGQAQLASTNGVTWTDDIASVFTASPDNLLVVPGRGGIVSTSPDGATWARTQTGTFEDLNDWAIAEGFFTVGDYPNVWVCVGDNGSIVSSASGLSWATHTSGTTENLHGVTWNGTAFIAVGDNGTILRSTNRLNWTAVNNSGNTDDYRAVIANAGVLIVVGNNSSILRSTDGGLTWADLNQFPMGFAEFKDVAYGDGLYVAVSPTGVTARSNDGIVWSAYAGRVLNAVEFGNGLFVGVGGSTNEASQFSAVTDGTAVSVMAEPSTYTITFTKASDSVNSIPGEATVYNNILGYGRNLKTGEEWSDKWVKFTLDTITGLYDYAVGDQIRIHLAQAIPYPPDTELFNQLSGYDALAYDIIGYDGGSVSGRNAKAPSSLNTELYPLYHSHGAVIFPDATAGDEIVIDKAFEENIKFRIRESSIIFPELGAVDDYLPLYFKYSDFADPANDFDTTLTKPAEYSDIAPFLEAFSAATGERVFYIVSPRFTKTNRSAHSQITIDQAFFDKYLTFNTKYSIAVYPQDSYGQTIRVKMTEALKVYARVFLELNDIATFNISEVSPTFVDVIGEVYFGEGPITGYWRWTNPTPPTMGPGSGEEGWTLVTPFNSPNDQAFTYPFQIDITEGGAYIENGYDMLGYEFFFGYDAEGGVIPFFHLNEIHSTSTTGTETGTPDVASSSIAEGLSISMSAGALDPEFPNQTVTSLLYDFDKQPDGITVQGPIADQYSITLANAPLSPVNLTVAPESDLGDTTAVVTYYTTYTYLDEFDVPFLATDTNALTFVPPVGLVAPFRLWLA